MGTSKKNNWRHKNDRNSSSWCLGNYINKVCNTDTTQTKLHQISNTQRTENKTTDVVIQQQSRKLLIKDILMSETCWAHKKWNKIASNIKLVIYSSTLYIHIQDSKRNYMFLNSHKILSPFSSVVILQETVW